MADRSFLTWPFVEPRHQELYDSVDAWAWANHAILHGEDESSAAAATTVRRIVAELGNSGLLATATGGGIVTIRAARCA